MMIIGEPIFFYLSFALIIASLTDILTFRIPNWLTYSTLAVGIAYFSVAKGYEGFLFSLGGAAAGLGLLTLPYIIGGTGAGDVKLLGAVGSFLGPKGAFIVFIFSNIMAGIYALGLMASKGLLIGTLKRYGKVLKGFIITHQFIYIPPSNKEKKIRIRFGFAIALGTISYLALWV
jgi:prepilin peptidase CpaA